MPSRTITGWITVAVIVGALLAIIPAPAVAASSGDLCLYGSDGTTNTGDPTMDGTRPSIGPLVTGAEVAFQNASGQLSTYADASSATTTAR